MGEESWEYLGLDSPTKVNKAIHSYIREQQCKIQKLDCHLVSRQNSNFILRECNGKSHG